MSIYTIGYATEVSHKKTGIPYLAMLRNRKVAYGPVWTYSLVFYLFDKINALSYSYIAPVINMWGELNPATCLHKLYGSELYFCLDKS